jgi:hypothetical protein
VQVTPIDFVPSNMQTCADTDLSSSHVSVNYCHLSDKPITCAIFASCKAACMCMLPLLQTKIMLYCSFANAVLPHALLCCCSSQ